MWDPDPVVTPGDNVELGFSDWGTPMTKTAGAANSTPAVSFGTNENIARTITGSTGPVTAAGFKDDEDWQTPINDNELSGWT